MNEMTDLTLLKQRALEALVARLNQKAAALAQTERLYREEAAEIANGDADAVKYFPEARTYVAKADALGREITLLNEASAAISSLLADMEALKGEIEEYGKAGERDGYEEAVADIDRMTGGDGEYRCCSNPTSDRHTPDADAMKRRIAERFAEGQRALDALALQKRTAAAFKNPHYGQLAVIAAEAEARATALEERVREAADALKQIGARTYTKPPGGCALRGDAVQEIHDIAEAALSNLTASTAGGGSSCTNLGYDASRGASESGCQSESEP
jgi:hypothetical protein